MKLYFPTLVASVFITLYRGVNAINGINYNARNGSDPVINTTSCKSFEDVYHDMLTVQGFTDKIRLNSLVECNVADVVMQFAAGIGVKVDLGISTAKGHDYFLQEKAKLGEIIDKGRFDTVVYVHVGNGALSHGDINITTAHERDSRGQSTPVSIADSVDVYNSNPQLLDAVDYVSVNHFAFWERADVNEGVAATLDRLKSLRVAAANKNKQLIISEAGWSSGGASPYAGVASPANQAKFYSDFIQMAHSHEIDYYWYDGFDSKWRDSSDADAHFGIYREAGFMKDDLLYLKIGWKDPRAIRNTRTKLVLSENDGKLHMSARPSDWLMQEQQVWFFDSKTQQVRSKSSDRCLDAYQPWDGGDVHVYRCMDGEANQRWAFDNVTNTLQHVTHKGFCLDQDPSQNNKVQLYGCSTNNPNQQWEIIDPASI